MSNKVEDMVESRHDNVRTARNLPDAANADQNLQGYAAINDIADADKEEIARLAHRYYQERAGAEGSSDDDWFRAEQEVRRSRNRAGD